MWWSKVIDNQFHKKLLFETSQEYFEHFDLWSETPSNFIQYFGFAIHKFCELFVTHGHSFSKELFTCQSISIRIF